MCIIIIFNHPYKHNHFPLIPAEAEAIIKCGSQQLSARLSRSAHPGVKIHYRSANDSVKVRLTAYYVKVLWGSWGEARRSSFIRTKKKSTLKSLSSRRLHRLWINKTKRDNTKREAGKATTNAVVTVRLIVRLSEDSLSLYKSVYPVVVVPHVNFPLIRRFLWMFPSRRNGL